MPDVPQAPLSEPLAGGRQIHLDYLDGLRGLSALYVAACHAYLTYAVFFLTIELPTLDRVLLKAMHWLSFGRSAVAVFIVISGYCLMLPIVRSRDHRIRGGLVGFMRRRARRILPPYYGALAVSLVIIAVVPGLRDSVDDGWHRAFWSQVHPAFDVGVIASHVLLIHNFDPVWQHAINYPMWSIATEWQIYWLFPVFVLIWHRNWRDGLVMNALWLTLGLQIALVLFGAGHNPGPPVFVTLFAFGMAAAAVNFPRPNAIPVLAPARSGRVAAWAFAVYVVVEATIGEWLLAAGYQQVLDLIVGIGSACLMIACTHQLQTGQRSFVLDLLQSRPVAELGRFSYSLYLMHAPILAVVFLALRGLELPGAAIQALMLTLGLPVAVAGSFLFYTVFERPFVRGIAGRAALPLPRRGWLGMG